jgi:hypothetical protein
MLSSSVVTGVSRRGDFEVLLFNLIDWLGGKLPWDQVSPNFKITSQTDLKYKT